MTRGLLSVVYVDDDALNLTVVSHMLDVIGARVTCFTSPDEALVSLQSQSFHVALLDIHMPQMSGIELLHRLRRQIGPNRATPAVALTADLCRDEHQYRELGFDGFVAKPVTLKSLLSGIARVLASTAAAERAGQLAAQRAASPVLRP